MNRADLLEKLSQDILAYVMQGSLPGREVAKQIKPEELDQRFEDYNLLLDLHFVLKEDVVNFVRELPKQLRDIKTETQRASQVHRGSIEGRINWGATMKHRYAHNPKDHSLFVCDNRSVDYDIHENVVLKKLISVIYHTIQQAEQYLKDDYDWVKESWRGEEVLIDELQRIVNRNVHVRRIRESKFYEPTERMLMAAESSRQPVYQEAAELLRKRQSLLSGDNEEIKTLLDETAITPDDDAKLFELFVLFRFVSILDRLRDDSVTFETIRTSDQAKKERRREVARFEENPRLRLYMNKSGSDKVSFVPEGEPPYRVQSRSEKVQRVARDVANNYFKKTFNNYTGRPDVLLEVHDEETGKHEYLVVEVKHSTRTSTIRQGIKETLEYLAFLRFDDSFVYEEAGSEEYFGSGWNGLLVIQDMDRDTRELSGQDESEMKIVQVSELKDEEQLGAVLSQAFENL